jgi:hypothetical protein
MRSEIKKNRGTQDQGDASIAALKPSYAVGFLKDPGASAANAADRASSDHQMKSDTEEPPNNHPTLVNVGRRKLVSFARRLTAPISKRHRPIVPDPVNQGSKRSEFCAKSISQLIQIPMISSSV